MNVIPLNLQLVVKREKMKLERGRSREERYFMGTKDRKTLERPTFCLRDSIPDFFSPSNSLTTMYGMTATDLSAMNTVRFRSVERSDKLTLDSEGYNLRRFDE